MPGRSSSSTTRRSCSRAAPRAPAPSTRPCRRGSPSRSAGSRRSWTGSKKKLPASVERKLAWVDAADGVLSVSRQCALLDLGRSSYYYEPATESAENLALMAMIDREYTAHPFRGSRGLRAWLRQEGHQVNRKRVQRLMRLMGLEAVYPKPHLSAGGAGHKVYPYLLRNVAIERANQVWSTDITYIPLPNGFMYLTAVIDWYSRYVLSWKLSNTLDVEFCLEALDAALC